MSRLKNPVKPLWVILSPGQFNNYVQQLFVDQDHFIRVNIFIIMGFGTIVSIFSVISTTFRVGDQLVGVRRVGNKMQ